MGIWDDYAADYKLEETNINNGTTTVDSFADTSAYGVVWRFVIDQGPGTNMRVGMVHAVWDSVSASTPEIIPEISSSDIGDTSGVSFTVDKSATTVRLRMTVTSNDWAFYGIRTLIGEA